MRSLTDAELDDMRVTAAAAFIARNNADRAADPEDCVSDVADEAAEMDQAFFTLCTPERVLRLLRELESQKNGAACPSCQGSGVEVTQRGLFDFVVSYQQLHGLTPSVRAVADGFGWSPGLAAKRLQRLEETGFVVAASKTSRLIITELGRESFIKGIWP